jgi:hypothetical protein
LKITRGHIAMSAFAIIVGGLLVYAGTAGDWGAVWVAAGAFFLAVGLGTVLISLAYVLPGPAGAILRSPAVSILVIAAVIIALLITVFLGMTQ